VLHPQALADEGEAPDDGRQQQQQVRAQAQRVGSHRAILATSERRGDDPQIGPIRQIKEAHAKTPRKQRRK
jgi:hypothetical protein